MNRRTMARVLWTGAAGAMLACALHEAQAQAGSPTQAARAGNTVLSARLHEAMAAAQHGDGDRALALSRALTAEHPEYEPALKFEGTLLEQMGRGPEAKDCYEQASRLAPGDTEVIAKLGVFQLLAGDKDDAIRLFTRRLKQAPRDGDTLYYLAQAYHLKGNDDLALKTIRRCLEVDPNNASVWQKYGELLCSSGDNEKALSWLLKARQADPALDRIEYDLGVASYNNQDLENAARYSMKAVELRPNDLKALALLAAVDVKLAKWQEAKPVFERILAVRSDDSAALLGLGHCELSLKNYAEAATVLERLLQQEPTQILAHFYLSRAYAQLGRAADAEHEAELHSRLLEQAASLTPPEESEVEQATVKEARQLLAEHRETEAVQLFRERSRGPDATPGEPYMLVGMVYLSMSRPEDAERLLNKSHSMDPAVRGAHTYLGILALQRGDLAKAESEFNAELAGEPNSQLAVAELGEVRYRQGRWAEAAERLAKSRTVSPALLAMLCDSYFHLGKVKEADLTAELVADYGKADPATVRGVIDLLTRQGQTELAQRLSGRIQ